MSLHRPPAADWLYLNPSTGRHPPQPTPSRPKCSIAVCPSTVKRRLCPCRMSPTSSDSPTCWLRTSAAVSACQPSRFWVPPGPFIGPPQRNARLPLTVPLQEFEDSTGLRFVTCTDGNWGRAVARMAKYLSVPAHVFVPQNVDQTTRDNIKSKGAEVPVVQGGYDAAIGGCERRSRGGNGLLVMDTSWPGYDEIPTWVVEGYYTMLRETDRRVVELTGRPATCAIASVGVGS